MAGSDRGVLRLEGGSWFGDPTVFHGEGAFWDDAVGALRWVDMLRGDVLTQPDAPSGRPGTADPGHSAGGAPRRVHVGDVAALIRRRTAGGYVVATERGFTLLDDELRPERAITVFDDSGVRMNEGACDAAGRLYCGSLAYDYHEGGGTLYRLDPDLSVHVVLDGVTIPNGLVWTADGTVALHADTADDAVHAYDVDPATGAFGRRRTHIDFSGTHGSPDGTALDAEGGLWVALWGGAAVHRYDAGGTLTAVVPLPVTNPTSCALGGASGTTLFVTTSRQGLDAPEEHAGLVYALDVGVRGAEVHPFGGQPRPSR